MSSSVRLLYSVSYAGLPDGHARVTYILPNGKTESMDVDLPWTSTRLEFPLGTRVVLSAEGPERSGSLQCTIVTSESSMGKELGASGTTSCRVEHVIGARGAETPSSGR